MFENRSHRATGFLSAYRPYMLVHLREQPPARDGGLMLLTTKTSGHV
jgi:hypothetical protein